MATKNEVAEETVETTEQVEESTKPKSIKDIPFEEAQAQEKVEEEETVEEPEEEQQQDSEPQQAEFKIEDDPKFKELSKKAKDLEQLQELIFSDEELSNLIITKLKGEQATKTQKEETVDQFKIPDPPQYFNIEDLQDSNSDSYKWFVKYGQSIYDNARNATLAQADQLFEQKWQEKERQRAETEQKNKLNEAISTVKKEVKADDQDWNDFLEWSNESNRTPDEVLRVMYKIYGEIKNEGSQTQTPEKGKQQEQPKPRQRDGLPNYSQIGGTSSDKVEVDEDAAFTKMLMDNAKKFNRKKYEFEKCQIK